MKTIWQYGRTGGNELEVSDDFQIQVPFTDIPPLKEIALEDQFFIPSEKRWKEIINSVDQEKLNKIDSLCTELKNDNKELTEKADTLAQISSKTMLASVQNSDDIERIIFSYEEIKQLYNWGYFTNKQVGAFVPSCITEEEAEKIINKES